MALPPLKYSPPDTPVSEGVKEEKTEKIDLEDDEFHEATEERDADMDNDRESDRSEWSITNAPAVESTPKLPRKVAFPWPASNVRVSPTNIPLPLSPTELDLDAVEAALTTAAMEENDTETPSYVPRWTGKDVKVSMTDSVSEGNMAQLTLDRLGEDASG